MCRENTGGDGSFPAEEFCGRPKREIQITRSCFRDRPKHFAAVKNFRRLID